MIRINITIESEVASDAVADLQRLAQIAEASACSVTADAAAEAPASAPAQAPAESAPATIKRTRTKKAPESAAPVAVPATPAAPIAPTPVAPAPAAPVTPAAPIAPAPVAPVAPVQEPAAAESTITIETLSRAGSGLVMAGRMADVMDLLKQFGVQAITQLKRENYPTFAAGLRALGANI